MTDLQKFNAFGLLMVARNRVSVTITAITSEGRTISKSAFEVMDDPILVIEPDETISASFAALIEADHSACLAIKEYTKLKSGLVLGDIEPVNSVMKKVMDKVLASITKVEVPA